MESEVKAIEERTNLLEQSLEEAWVSLKKEIDKLNIDQRFTMLLDRINEQSAEIDSSIRELEKRIDALENLFQDLQGAMEKLESVQTQQSQQIEDVRSLLERETTSLEEKIIFLENQGKEAEDILRLLVQEKEKLKETIDTLHQSLSSVEDELNTISLQWDSKWQGISEDISNWQEATLEDIEAKIVSIKQELPDRSELEEWEKK